MSKFVLLAVVMVLQVYLTMANDASEGILERAKEAYSELKTKVVDVSSTAYEFMHMYYEDQVKPVTDPYVEWAKDRASSVWESIKNRVSGDEAD